MESSNDPRIKELEREITLLRIELQNARLREIEKEKNLNNYVRELDAAKQLNVGSLLREKELQTLAESWERIVDELAHSINNDVYVAVSAMSKFLDNPRIKKASYHTRQIRDLTNLLMLYLKRNDISYTGELSPLDITQTATSQLELIKDGISTLRISSDEHEEALLKLEVPISSEGDCGIEITSEFIEAVPLVIKDLVRNSLKHTTEEYPRVEISVKGYENFVQLTIENNGTIPQKLADWFNKGSTEDPENMSKSSKVGLRVVKKWVELLTINTKYYISESGGSTTVIIKFPRRIVYAQG